MDNDIVIGKETDRGATKCLSFKSYAAKKNEERSTHFRSSGSKKKRQKRKEEDPLALINVGRAGNNFSSLTGHVSFQIFILVGHLINLTGH